MLATFFKLGFHFIVFIKMETELEKRGKHELLSIVRSVVPAGVSCIYVRQPEALGLGHAVLCAKSVVGNESFAVILADDLIDGDGANCLTQMAAVHENYECSILGVEEVPRIETEKYGIVSTSPLDPAAVDRISKVNAIVEKPHPDVASSNLAVVGRYILTPRIFELLEHTERGAGDEIQLTDAIARLLMEERVLAYRFLGKRHDCGDKLGYLQATVEYALRHPQLKDEFREYLQSILPEL